jgi:hypothetical protein
VNFLSFPFRLTFIHGRYLTFILLMWRIGRAPNRLTFILLMWRIGRAPNNIPVYSYIQQDATPRSLFISGNCSTCFGWYFHPSSGVHSTVSTASGICHTLTAICRYRGRVGTGLSVLWVAYATHTPPTALQASLHRKVVRLSALRTGRL